MHRPLIDLGPSVFPIQTHYHQAATFAFKSVNEGGTYPRLHGSLNASAREAILRETGDFVYMVDHPRDVPEDSRTREWSVLCTLLEAWEDLSGARKVHVAWLLYRLGMQPAVLMQTPDAGLSRLRMDEDSASLVLLRGMAQLSLYTDGAYEFDERLVEAAAELSPRGGWAHLEATYLLASSAFRNRADPRRGAHWLMQHKAAVEHADVDEHTNAKLYSRYFRLHAFVHQFSHDFKSMSRDMNLAKDWLDRMDQGKFENYVEWYTLRTAYLESSIKEAFLLRNFELALRHAEGLVVHTPFDSRSWLELGQVSLELNDVRGALNAYTKAAHYGPPGTDVARFMMGQCYEMLEEPDRAVDSYLLCLKLDAQAVSAVERLVELAATGVCEKHIGAWARSRLDELTHGCALQEEEVLPYQQYDGFLGQ
jgi:tetratricopeptide (TPR) repeat protein